MSAVVVGAHRSSPVDLPRGPLLVLGADHGTSVAACSRKGAVWDGTGATTCLTTGGVLATGADVIGAVPVRTPDGWFVRITLTPAAAGRLRQHRGHLVHEIVNGVLLNEIVADEPVLIGNGAHFDEETAEAFATELRPS